MTRLFLVNQTPATPAEAIYQLKELLKSAGWGVPCSSDGSVYNAAGDQISSGASGLGGMDNARAWFVIQMPGTTRQFCLQRNSATGANTSQYWRIKYSKGAGFSGGAPAILVTPTATDEQVLLGAGSDAVPTFFQTLFAYGDGIFRFHCCADNIAPYGFLSWSWRCTSGLTGHSFALEPLQATAPEDTDPYVIPMSPAPGADASWMKAAFNYSAGWGLHGWCGTTFYKSAGGTPCMLASVFGAAYDPWTSCNDNIYNGKDDVLPLTTYVQLGTTTPYFLYKGIFTITRAIAQAGRHTGDLYTISAAKDGVCVGNCVLPWDGSSTPLV